MNRERMLGVFQNLLMEYQEAGFIDTKGNNGVIRILLDGQIR